MAVLTITGRSARIPAGPYWMQTYKSATTADSQDAEWVAMEFGNIVAVVGSAVEQITGATSTLNFMKNAQGTGVAEGTNPGDLGVESIAGAAACTFEVTVLGD